MTPGSVESIISGASTDCAKRRTISRICASSSVRSVSATADVEHVCTAFDLFARDQRDGVVIVREQQALRCAANLGC